MTGWGHIATGVGGVGLVGFALRDAFEAVIVPRRLNGRWRSLARAPGCAALRRPLRSSRGEAMGGGPIAPPVAPFPAPLRGRSAQLGFC